MPRTAPRQVQIVAHNIRSAENVGSLFRTCDSLGVTKLWLTGYTPTPEHPRVAKTALGAESSVVWERATDVGAALADLRRHKFRIVGLELDEKAVELSAYAPPGKVALLLGNEVQGIPPSLRAECDDVVYISQRGVKESLNVGVAAGIAAYWILNSHA